MLLYCLVVLGGFNCADAYTACNNPQASCSSECKHKLVARMGWCCLWCLKHVDNLVSMEEKEILWRTEEGELMSKDEWKVEGKTDTWKGKRTRSLP